MGNLPEQVAVFLENRPGKLERVTSLLAAEGINIRAITIADSGDFGVLKLLLDDPKRARDLLVAKGMAAALKEVVAVSIPDRPGALNRISTVLTRHGINLEDAYGFVLESGRRAVFVIQVKEPAATAAVLRKEGLDLLKADDLYFL